MPNITDNVSFEHVAREWRCKWADPECLSALQTLLDTHLADMKVGGWVPVAASRACGARQTRAFFVAFPFSLLSVSFSPPFPPPLYTLLWA